MKFDSEKYELLLQLPIDELKSEGYLFKHRKSGARVALVANDDENKVFSIGFRTPPPDSTGVPHILEHSVLCGSDKYPVKDPFIELAKGSLNTFLNAITYPDKTIYPVASCNDADFKNLMDVYMDAALHPLIDSRKEVFLQEGWHYEMENEDAPLTYNGVVYNEMKGAYSAPDDVLGRYCINSLYPDTSYGTESGGDPKNIPDLTYENFVAFHKKLYHPANSYIYLYGNCDMEERLEYLDREYLCHYDAITVDSELKTQAPFAHTRHVEAEYSVTEEEGTQGKSYLAYNFSISDSLDTKTCYGMEILDYALLSAPGAPVKQALIDAGIGSDVYSSYEDGIKQPMFSIIAKDTDPEREEEFVAIIRSTLEDLVENGLNRQTLMAGINSEEFKYREADFGRFPKGLMYGLNLMSTWLYDEKHPFDRLALNEVYEFLKANVDTGFFEGLIDKYLLKNQHASLVVLKPVIDLTSREEERVAAKLAAYKASLTKEEIRAIVEQTAALKAYQSEPNTEEELQCIPLLSREDIRKEIIPLTNEITELGGVTVDHHDIYTNGIGYLNLCFDVAGVEDEDLPYLGILGAAMGYIDTDGHAFDEFSNEVDIHTGGIFPDFTIYQDFEEQDRFTAMFQIKSKALLTKFDKVFALIREMMYTSHYGDGKRMKEILLENKSHLQEKLLAAGHAAAIGEAGSQLSEGDRIQALTSGIPYYDFISDILAHYEERRKTIADKLDQLTKTILCRKNLTVSITADEEQYAPVRGLLEQFILSLPEGDGYRATRHFTYGAKKIGYKTAGQVNYVARVGNYKKHGQAYAPALKVMKTILGYDYLWNQVRVLGGAYGCMNGFDLYGNGYFVSYRDPNCANTNAVYEKVPEYLESFEVSEREMTKYIIGTFSEMDVPLTPSTRATRSFAMYMRRIPEEFLQQDRDAVLATTPDKIRALAPIVSAVLSDESMVVIGSSDTITKDAAMFDEIRTLA